MAIQIVCMGEPLIEFNQQENGGLFKIGYGGDTSNTAIAASRHGASTAYVSRVGADKFGQMLRTLWTEEGVDHKSVLESENSPTGVYFVTHGEAGHEFSYLRSNSAASKFSFEDVPEQLIANASILHLSAISQAISTSACDACFHAIEIAKSNGVKVSYDTNLRLPLWPITRAQAIINETIQHADILLPGLDDIQQITGLDNPNEIIEVLLEKGPSAIALTMGKEGVVVATPEKQIKISPHKVNAVDATGAGDAFDGAFLAEYIHHQDVIKAAKFANASAALSTEGYGAVAPLPIRESVESYLGKGK